MIEILAPAGDEQSAYSAINAGANAIYLGLTSFSARSSAKNFDFKSLKKLITHAHFFGVKIYVAMNTLVKESELSSFVSTAVEAWNTGVDAIILQDLYLGSYLKKTYPQMVLHLSTQAGICNEYGARYAKELGFDRVILARETKLSDIEKIAKIIETEVFVQGALCTCFSGQCYLSSFAGGNSGNRGKCKQPCRKRYKINRKGFENYAYRISLSDLSVGENINKLKEAGVSSFKIEGRMRRPEYVSSAVAYYKKLLNCEDATSQLSALKRTYNRGNYTKGLAFGQDKSFISSAVQGHIGEYVGTVWVENGKFIVRTSMRCNTGDGFKILRDGTELCGAVYAGQAKGGIELKSSTRLKNGDKAFITTDTKLNAELLANRRTAKVYINAYFKCGEAPEVTINGRNFKADFIAEKATGRPLTADDVKVCFSKIDAYPFEIEFGDIQIDGEIFIPVSRLNSFRRQAFAQFFESFSEEREELKFKPISTPSQSIKQNSAVCVIATNLNGVKADIGVLKPDKYDGDLTKYFKGFNGEKFLYLPPYLSGEDIGLIKSALTPFDGIYSGGNYAVPLAKELNKKLFAGVGFNLSNTISVSLCPADYKALSKELTIGETKPLCTHNTFALTEGDIKVMDLIYCPFAKTCKECDKRSLYELTDESNRVFPLRRYTLSECRFELFNCANLVSSRSITGQIKEITIPKESYKSHTKGHTETPVL
ncbi:MAG: U32 family peptidase [Candidatus Coproplasma sp.]